MFVNLSQCESATLSAQILLKIAEDLLPQLQMFRFHVLSGMHPFISSSHPLSRFELARNLGGCVPEDPGVVQVLTPLFESHEAEVLAQRSRDPNAAILEAIWGPLHERGELGVGKLRNA
jgi:hypothetical protein